MAIPRLPVLSPDAPPLPYSLLSVANVIDESDPHWTNGVTVEPDACEEAHTVQQPCDGSANKTPTTTGIAKKGAEPFAVYAWIDCSPIGHWEDYAARTVAALENGEARAVEREFWTGAAGTNPNLAANAAVTDTDGTVLQSAATVLGGGAAVDIVEAVALLEGALASCYPGIGVIHAPRRALAFMSSKGLLDVGRGQVGPQLRTDGGTLLAFGGGYPGTGKAGVAPSAGDSWMFATGQVQIRRDEVARTERVESLGRSRNTMVLLAERTYTALWDCSCHFAVLADTGTVSL